MAEPRSKMTPLLTWEWVVGLSPIAATVVAYVALANLSLEGAAVGFTTRALDGLCAGGLPAFWCRMPKPVTLLAAVQFMAFLWFILASAYMFWRVRFAPGYPKPPAYVPGSASLFEMASWGGIWLFMLIGGQIFPYRGQPLAEPSLLFAMLGLSLALLSLRMLAVSLRFRA
ncbi:hypothetical protein [uncultured Reyranella sp.]|jgi:hypothetical protein|uniref:hypothetical protein n=1 Tax=uncultured Reyranella sp. TaxID=735512 RepID=UPI00259C81B3|nr:hypothetical protein [uncultured Reyranella sp.]